MAALWRRKVLALVAVVLSVCAGYGAAARSGAAYTYSATTLLLPPSAARYTASGAVDYTAGNPLFYLGNLGQARDILIGGMTSKDVQEETGRKYPGTTYTIGSDVLNSAPVVILSASGPNEADSKALVAYLAQQLPTVLAQVQKGVGVASSAQITSYLLTSDARPVVSHKAQVRAAIFATGAAAVLMLLVLGAVDALLRGRHTRRRGRTARARSGPADSEQKASDRESPVVVVEHKRHEERPHKRHEERPHKGDDVRPQVVDADGGTDEGTDEDGGHDIEAPAWLASRRVVGR